MLLEIKNGVYPKIGNGSTPLKTASAECAPARTAEYDLRQTLCCHQKQPDPARSATNRYSPAATTAARAKPAASARGKSAST